MNRLIAVAALALAAAPAFAEEMVPFAIPMTPNAASSLAMTASPIAADGPRLAIADGRFAAAGKRVRIWGVNICFGGAVPTHADAEVMAARLAAAGVNSVRFHHMDSSAWPRGILEPKDKSKLHPEAMDRLDYFIDQLARRSIYANVNLHVGREASVMLGLPKSNTKYDKIVGIFTPALVDAQKQFARDLLTHVNAYRKVRYADDAAVGFVEITNEDSLFMWSARKDLRELPEFYAKILNGQYSAWLKGRYGSTEVLRKAWSIGANPLGANMLAADKVILDAKDKAVGWRLEQHEGCSAKAVLKEGGALRFEIAKADDTSWHLQLKQSPLAVKGGQYYTLSFRAKADKPREIAYGLTMNHAPYENLGLSGNVKLTPEWKAVRIGFTAKADDADARLSFALGTSAASVDLADVSLAPGGREGLLKDESIEAGNVALHAPGEVTPRTLDRNYFLTVTERAYFDKMRDFLKKDLGVKALVTGTQVYGPLGFYGQAGQDYVDSHAYWKHPSFPGRPWDPNNWTVAQAAMVDNPASATLPRLAAERMDGKPYTVSEYNHPAPNDFQAETIPMLAAYAAAQDWDGVWLFCYTHAEGLKGRDRIVSYFDIDGNPAKWGFMRAGAAIFRDGGIPPLRRSIGLCIYNTDDMFGELGAVYEKCDRDMLAVANTRMAVAWEDLTRMSYRAALEGHSGVEDTGVQVEPTLAWTVDAQKRGAFMASGPGAAVLVGHVPGGLAVTADGLGFSKPEFAALTMTPLDGRPLAESKSILITACSRAENTGMQFSPDRRTVGRNWGGPPVLIEPVTGCAVLPPGTWKCQALGPDGLPTVDVPVAKDAKGRPVVNFTPEYKTMWYLVTAGK